MNLNKFFSVPISNLFQKGKMMKLAKSLVTILIAATFAVSGCMQQESNDASSSSEKTIIEVNLGEHPVRNDLWEVSMRLHN